MTIELRPEDKIYVAGHKGLVGSAIVRRLHKSGLKNTVLKTSSEVDLRCQHEVDVFFGDEKPDFVFLAAAKVGGIYANDTYPADFIRDNLQIQTNVIDAAYRYGARKLLFLGSSCIYPKLATQPIKESSLLSSSLEPTNEFYAIAKIAGLKMCAAYRRQYGFDAISLMPTNLYGPGDNYDLENSHVIPALLRKFHEAKVSGKDRVVVWGTGTPRREFMHVDDLADASLFLMRKYSEEGHVNVGVGEDISIAELAALVAKVVNYEGDIVYNTSKPDGTPRKLLDVLKLSAIGWKASIDLEQGLKETYRFFVSEYGSIRGC